MSSKYQNGQIYKIVDVGFNKCYIGSTCESLSQRMARHRICYKSFLKGTSGRIRSFDLFDEFGVENCKIVWIEDYPCESRKQLEAREGHHIANTDCVNRCQLGRTREEYSKMYREKYPEQVKEAKKKWYYDNPQKAIDASKKWAQENPERVRANGKKYRDNNQEKEYERHQKYYETHREQINQNASRRIECECGVECRKDWINKHRKTKAHLKWVKQQEEL